MTRGGIRPGAGRPKTNPEEALDKVLRVSVTEKDFILFSRIKKINLEKLKKSLMVIFAMLCLCMPVNALVLQGSVEYTVESAREIAFNNTDMTVDNSEYSKYASNLYNYGDIAALKAGIFTVGIGSFSERQLVPFYAGKTLIAYGVKYSDLPNKKFYYDKSGKLIKFDIIENGNKYPHKELSYDKQGKLISANLVISKNESYVYDSNKKLIGHWVNNVHYNEKGEASKLSRHL